MNKVFYFIVMTFAFLGLQNGHAQSLADFPAVSSQIDQDNCCMNESVTLFNLDGTQFIYVENDVDCFGPGGRLYLADGTLWCEDGNINCLQFYGLNNGTSIFECTAGSDLELFDLFPFLGGLVDVNNCQDEVIEYYRNTSGHEFLCIVEDGTRSV